jgi:uncharacterized protein YndB with AHSA1/START domain
MARFVDAIDLPLPIGEAFDYLADFSHTAEWDPGVAEAERLTPGAPRQGSRFRVVVSFLGRRLPLEYEIREFERPSRLVLVGGDEALRSIDEITFVPRAGGTRVTYEARLELTGIRRLADPLLHLLFQRIGSLAVRGLRERMAGRRAGGAPGAPHRAGVLEQRHRQRARSARERGGASTNEEESHDSGARRRGGPPDGRPARGAGGW